MHIVPPPPNQKKIHNHCFQFLLGITVVRREIEDNGYAKVNTLRDLHTSSHDTKAEFNNRFIIH